MSATSRNRAAATRIATLRNPNEAQATEPRADSVMSTVQDGWLRTGANRLVPIPLSLREWSGIQNRSKFGENSTPRQKAKRAAKGRK
jgi:hypothetical protein